MPPTSQPTDVSGQLLLLVSEQQVYAFDLSKRVRVGIGRHESNDLVLRSRTVSNYHAEILQEGEGLVLRDLGSTNGTFVDEAAVKQGSIKAGDRIRIGNHILTVHLKSVGNKEEGFFRFRRNPDSFGPGTRGNIISVRSNSEDALKTLQARDPLDVSLADLLKILSSNAHSLIIWIQRESEEAHVFAKRDRIVHAEYGKASGEKALYRLFGWQRATYELKPLTNGVSVPQTIALPTDTLVVEGMKHASDLGRLIAQLPPLQVPLRLREDCPLPLTAHTPAEIEIYQCVIRYETIAEVLEQSPLTDVRVLRLIDSLVRKGVFEISTNSDVLLEDTFVSARPVAVNPPGRVE